MSNKLPHRMIFDGLNCYPESAFPDWVVKKEGWQYVTVSAEAPSPVVMPEDVVEAMTYAAHFESDPPVVGNAKLVVALARYIRSLSSPAPVEGLPEGFRKNTPRTNFFAALLEKTFGKPDANHWAMMNDMTDFAGALEIEVNRLSALTGQAKKGE